jgi:peptidoglycan-associated lipoprotein
VRLYLFLGIGVCLLLIGGCVSDNRPQIVAGLGEPHQCSSRDFGAIKGQLFTSKAGRRHGMPPEIDQIRHGAFEQFDFYEFTYWQTWIGVDLDKNQLIKVERNRGVLYGSAKLDVIQSQLKYLRDDPNAIDIINIRPLSDDEVNLLACSANDLWLDGPLVQDAHISGTSSKFVLRDGEVEKAFEGDGMTGGRVHSYVQTLHKFIENGSSDNMDPVRRSILHDGNLGFSRDIGDRYFFDPDNWKLSDKVKDQLDRLAFYLSKRPQLRLLLEGHADDPGSVQHNLILSRERVTEVKAYLAKHGVDPFRIETVSSGKERPAVLGKNESASVQNRRVVGHLEQLQNY